MTTSAAWRRSRAPLAAEPSSRRRSAPPSSVQCLNLERLRHRINRGQRRFSICRQDGHVLATLSRAYKAFGSCRSSPAACNSLLANATSRPQSWLWRTRRRNFFDELEAWLERRRPGSAALPELRPGPAQSSQQDRHNDQPESGKAWLTSSDPYRSQRPAVQRADAQRSRCTVVHPMLCDCPTATNAHYGTLLGWSLEVAQTVRHHVAPGPFPTAVGVQIAAVGSPLTTVPSLVAAAGCGCGKTTLQRATGWGIVACCSAALPPTRSPGRQPSRAQKQNRNVIALRSATARVALLAAATLPPP